MAGSRSDLDKSAYAKMRTSADRIDLDPIAILDGQFPCASLPLGLGSDGGKLCCDSLAGQTPHPPGEESGQMPIPHSFLTRR